MNNGISFGENNKMHFQREVYYSELNIATPFVLVAAKDVHVNII